MKKVISILLACVMLLALAACGQQAAPAAEAPQAAEAPTEPEAKKPVMGVCLWAIEVEYFTNLAHWMEEAGADHGWDVIVASGDANDPSSQIDIIENFVTAGVDAIFINPINIAAVESALKEAKDAGIFIFGHNYRYEDSEVPSVYLCGDPVEVGARITNMAHTIAGNMGVDDATIVCGAMSSLDNENNSNRSKGMVDQAKALWGDDAVVAESFPGNVEEAMAAAENMYTSHPEINMWLCYNDETASGGYQFYKANNMDQSKVIIVGADGNADILEAINAGTAVRGTLSQALNVRTQDFFAAADILINGGTEEEAQKVAGYDLFLEVDASNVADQLAAANWK